MAHISALVRYYKEEGLIARDYLIEWLSSGEIELEIRSEGSQNGKGSFGRWLGILCLEGVNINIELVENNQHSLL